MPGYLKWSLYIRFPHQNPVYASPLPHTRYMSHPSHSSRFYHPNNTVWLVSIIKILLRRKLHSCYLVPLGPKNILLNTLFSNTLSLCTSLNVRDQVSHPYKTTGTIIVLYILLTENEYHLQ
jgi:hypothetical protein